VNRVVKTADQKNVSSKARIFKRRFDAGLRHVKLILMTYRESMPQDEWSNLLNQTRHAVLHSPNDFFGSDLPPHDITTEAINQVFEGFLQDIRIRKIQAFRKNPVVP
jgi:hypothetical protein